MGAGGNGILVKHIYHIGNNMKCPEVEGKACHPAVSARHMCARLLKSIKSQSSGLTGRAQKRFLTTCYAEVTLGQFSPFKRKRNALYPPVSERILPDQWTMGDDRPPFWSMCDLARFCAFVRVG